MRERSKLHRTVPQSAADTSTQADRAKRTPDNLTISAFPRIAAQRRAMLELFGATIQRNHKGVNGDSISKSSSIEDDFAEEGMLQARSMVRPVHTSQPVTGPTTLNNGASMPGQLMAGIAALSGIDISDVNVHRNSDRPAQLNALAYAQGNDIHLGPGQEQHLPHEAWHVVQQRQGKVKETMKFAGIGVNDEATLENEADSMGERALALGQSSASIGPANLRHRLTPYQFLSQGSSSPSALQRAIDVTVPTNTKTKKIIRAQGNASDFDDGSEAEDIGWLGVEKYQASIEAVNGKFNKKISFGPKYNIFTTPERGHILAKNNGGNGGDPNNVFAQDGGTNNGPYKAFENESHELLNSARYKNHTATFECILVGKNITRGSIKSATMADPENMD